MPLVDAFLRSPAGPATPGNAGRLIGDRGFDDEEERQKLRNRGIEPELAKRRTPTAAPGCVRSVVDRRQ